MYGLAIGLQVAPDQRERQAAGNRNNRSTDKLYPFSRPTHSTALPPLRKPCDEFGKMRTHRSLEV